MNGSASCAKIKRVQSDVVPDNQSERTSHCEDNDDGEGRTKSQEHNWA